MKDAQPTKDCHPADITAYLDGELDAATTAACEIHFATCKFCSEQLAAQKAWLNTLDAAFANGGDAPALPENFARVVTATASADLSGLRSSTERRRALRLTGGLIFLIVALTGGTLFTATSARPVLAIWQAVVMCGGFIGRGLYSIATGVAVVGRAVGGYLFFDARLMGALLLFVLLLSALLLPRLIYKYHRTQSPN